MEYRERPPEHVWNGIFFLHVYVYVYWVYTIQHYRGKYAPFHARRIYSYLYWVFTLMILQTHRHNSIAMVACCSLNRCIAVLFSRYSATMWKQFQRKKCITDTKNRGSFANRKSVIRRLWAKEGEKQKRLQGLIRSITDTESDELRRMNLIFWEFCFPSLCLEENCYIPCQNESKQNSQSIRRVFSFQLNTTKLNSSIVRNILACDIPSYSANALFFPVIIMSLKFFHE